MRLLRLTTILTVLLAALLMAGACGSEEPTATPRPEPTPTPPPAAPQPEPTPTAEAMMPKDDPTPTPTLAPGQPTPTPAPPTATPTATPVPPPSFNPETYLAGKTIRVIVGWDPATSSDLQARYIASELPRFMLGSPRMIVTNKPGASSIIANNFMAKAEPDGLTIFWGVGGQPTSQLTRADETEYEFDKFVRIGTFENRPAAWYISGDAPYSRIQDAMGGTEEFTYGTTTFSATVELMKQALNLPVRQVLGIQGGTTGFLLAFDRGDVDSMISGSGWYRIARDRPGWFTDGYIEPFAIIADPTTRLQFNGEIEPPDDLVNVRSLMSEEHVRDFEILTATDGALYRTGFMPPGTPHEVRNLFSDALVRAFQDAAFIEGLTKLMGRAPDELIPGPELDAIAQSFSVTDLDGAYQRWDPNYESPLN